ncbi:MAG TPA: cysteine desulfurase family protein, partial [Trueperaceae bacterium]|nr:cysteine desulfurase family protein [Trueperaceae bacterium]
MDRIYLDHAATTPLDPAVLEAMLPYLTEVHGNPSSLHASGRRARRGVEEARERVAAVMRVRPKQVVFTSGATEADNLALRGLLVGRGGALLTSPLEHAAVLRTAERLAEEGRRVEHVTHGPGGSVGRPEVEGALARAGETALVALMLVNNETGALLDAAGAAAAAREAGALFFCDAVQGLGVEDVSLPVLGADAAALSAHKVGGPKGVGALVLGPGLDVEPLMRGGSQERGFRPGTHAVAAVVGMGAAVELAEARRAEHRRRLAALQAELETLVTRVPGVTVNGSQAPRSVKHVNVSVAGVDGETLLMALDDAGVEVSAGSACAAGSLEPSHVLLALGLSPAAAKASVRFSLGYG